MRGCNIWLSQQIYVSEVHWIRLKGVSIKNVHGQGVGWSHINWYKNMVDKNKQVFAPLGNKERVTWELREGGK